MAKKKKDENKVKVTLVGSSGSTVTGSAYKVEFLNKIYYIDMGLYQEKDMKRNYYVNYELANQIRKEVVEAVILTHSHL
jgi:Cft2 family RNA processing exonuclease